MKRLSAGVLLALLALTTAACGDDGDSTAKTASKTATSTPSAGSTPEETPTGGGTGSDEVAAYCKRIDAFVTKAEQVVDSKDASAAAELSQEAGELASAASGMTDVSAEDAKVLTDCSNKAAKALQDLAAKMNG
jgi:glucose/arabinose dehydrogenase